MQQSCSKFKKRFYCGARLKTYNEVARKQAQVQEEGVDRGGGGTGVEGAESGVEGAESGMEGAGSGGRGGGKRG